MSVDAVSLLIAYSCGALGLISLGVLGWVSERHGPDLTYGEVS